MTREQNYAACPFTPSHCLGGKPCSWYVKDETGVFQCVVAVAAKEVTLNYHIIPDNRGKWSMGERMKG